DAAREVGQDVHVVAALAHRLDRLLHVDGVVACARPGRVHVVALPEGGGGQHDVGVLSGGRQEVILHHQQLHAVERLHHLVDVGRLVEEIATNRVDQLDVRRVVAALAARQEVGQQRGGDAGVDRIGAGGEALDAGAPRGSVA